MPIAAVLLMVAQNLPTIIDDAEAAWALIDGTHAAVTAARAGNGIVPVATIQALGLTLPTAIA